MRQMEHIRHTTQQNRPFSRITRYAHFHFDGAHHSVSIIVKGKSAPPTAEAPRLSNAMFLTLPFKNEKKEIENAVIGFIDKRYAQYYTNCLKEEFILPNDGEPLWNPTVITHSIEDASFYAHILGVPLVVVGTMWCDDKILDPVMEVFVTREPYKDPCDALGEDLEPPMA